MCVSWEGKETFNAQRLGNRTLLMRRFRKTVALVAVSEAQLPCPIPGVDPPLECGLEL